MKRDSQANELAEQRTLLPGERELLAKSGALLKVFRCEACFPESRKEVPSASLSAGPYFAPGDANVFARPRVAVRKSWHAKRPVYA